MHNMLRRRLKHDAMCPRYDNGTETTIHAFRECSVAIETWRMLGLAWVFTNSSQTTFDWLTWVLVKAQSYSVDFFAVLCGSCGMREIRGSMRISIEQVLRFQTQ